MELHTLPPHIESPTCYTTSTTLLTLTSLCLSAAWCPDWKYFNLISNQMCYSKSRKTWRKAFAQHNLSILVHQRLSFCIRITTVYKFKHLHKSIITNANQQPTMQPRRLLGPRILRYKRCSMVDALGGRSTQSPLPCPLSYPQPPCSRCSLFEVIKSLKVYIKGKQNIVAYSSASPVP